MSHFMATLCVVVLALTTGCHAPERAPAGPSVESTATTPSKGEGITVRGRWVIEVRDPDGTLARHAEVHNDFLGAATVAYVLTKVKTPGWWVLYLGDTLCNDATSTSFCYRISGPTADPTGQLQPGAIVRSGSGPALEILLSATVQAENDGNLTRIGSGIQVCDPDVSVDDCRQSGPFQWQLFSERVLDVGEQIPVLEGQFVSADVTFTFGPG